MATRRRGGRRRTPQPARGDTGRTARGDRAGRRRPDPHPCRRADEGGRGLHRLVRRAAGRMAARQCRNRPALVPDPRHPHDRRRDRRLCRAAAPSPAFARSPKPISATAPLPPRRFLDAGGRFGIGSDSNVLIGVADELRQLEYSQRLARRERNVLGKTNGSTGRRLFDEALRGGAQALGAGPAGIAPGNAADLVSLDAAHPTLAGKTRRRHPRRLDLRRRRHRSIASGRAGESCVAGGRHHSRDAIATAFRAVMTELIGELAMDAQPVSLAPAHPRRHQRADRLGRLAARPPHPVRA